MFFHWSQVCVSFTVLFLPATFPSPGVERQDWMTVNYFFFFPPPPPPPKKKSLISNFCVVQSCSLLRNFSSCPVTSPLILFRGFHEGLGLIEGDWVKNEEGCLGDYSEPFPIVLSLCYLSTEGDRSQGVIDFFLWMSSFWWWISKWNQLVGFYFHKEEQQHGWLMWKMPTFRSWYIQLQGGILRAFGWDIVSVQVSVLWYVNCPLVLHSSFALVTAWILLGGMSSFWNSSVFV